jgi:hypothetical protein
MTEPNNEKPEVEVCNDCGQPLDDCLCNYNEGDDYEDYDYDDEDEEA